MEILVLQNVCKNYDGVLALDDVSMVLGSGEITAIIGPNGAGKTTLFDIITGFVRPDAGCVLFRGQDITTWPPYAIARAGIGHSFQHARLFPNMSVLENAMVAYQREAEHPLFRSLFRRRLLRAEEARDQEAVRKNLARVGLESKSDALASTLSQGQRRLLELAMILSLGSEIILLDEPTAGVYPHMIGEIKQQILAVRELGKTILLIEHNVEFVMEVAHKIIVLNYGRKIAEGKPHVIRQDQNVIDAYLGKRA